jgi:hypothetical protein
MIFLSGWVGYMCGMRIWMGGMDGGILVRGSGK